jgi:DNA-binding transcriptional LysR family regulator
MPDTQRTVQATDADRLAGLAAFPAALLEVTFDQLRTFLMVHETGSALAAARALGREQSSVQKQLDTLNRTFQQMCGELLVMKQGRGEPFLFTPTGAVVAARARKLLAGWQSEVSDARRRIGQTLAVGTTEFTVSFLGRAWERVADEFQSREIDLKVLHVRTRDSFARLDAKEIDILCGGFAASTRTSDIYERYEFLEWHREGVCLLTNLPKRELPVPAVSASRLPATPLIIPTSGVIADFLRRWYGPDFQTRLTIAATIDDIYYGLALLRSRMSYGCMIVSEAIGKAVTEGELPGGPGLRLVRLADDFDPVLELVTGAFARKGERDRFASSHPLNLLWDALRAEVTPPADDPSALARGEKHAARLD